MKCRRCGSQNIFIQQVQTGATTKSKDKYYVKHHSLLYWLLIGWWWWIVELLFQIMLALCTCGLSLFFRKKTQVGYSKGKSSTMFQSKSVAICQNCGKRWNCRW